ncbi:MAG: hypothetical protein J0L81_16690 [Caulobacterales bacterium]|jgi:hypothetical protein|nr:hypothetical protein [Caulobacterales bacterium]
MRLNKNAAAIAAIAMTALTVSAAFADADARTRRAQGAAATQRGAAETTRERGQRARDTNITGPNGRTRATHDDRAWSRESGTYTHDRTTRYANGDQRSVDTDVLRTGEGAYSASREVTGRNGETRVQTGDFTRTQTENGHSVSGDINTTHAGQIDYQRDVTREDGVRSVNSSATFEDGASINRASSASCANGSCASSGVVTARNGDQTSWNQTRTRTENGAIVSRDTTFADGTIRSMDRERVGNGDGTGVITRSITDRDGDTRTQTGEYEITRTP